MKRSLVSCIVPVRNGERYIGETLHSIQAQTHRDVEVIVVDDGSSDRTRQVVERCGGSVEYIRVEYANSTAARNRGLEACLGDYVAFLDADDLWRHDKLDLQLRALAPLQGPVVCVCQVRNFYSPDTVAPGTALAMPDQRSLPGFVPGALLTHRRVFERVGGFDAALPHGSALDWFVRARESGCREVVVPQVLVQRRLHGSNLSIRNAPVSRREHLRVVRAALRRRQGRAAVDPPKTS